MALLQYIDEVLPKLRPHLPVFLGCFASFNAVQFVLVPAIARVLFPVKWKTMNARTRHNWATHICSQIHAALIIPLAIRCLWLPELDADRAFGWHERSGTVQAVASAYFLYDFFVEIIKYESLAFVVHGLACFAIYLLSFKPFLAFYASRCLLWEASTFFLNIHWMLDKANLTGSIYQIINGVFLTTTFFCVRIVYGGYTSYQFFQTLYNGRDVIPLIALLITGIGNIVLQGLNWFWFTQMIASLRKRFSPKKQKDFAAANGHKSE
ncbi:TLC domain-containing protein [Roridomyces roridus]|uniref:TLC domain-containing protein n=1 Tax=Roridomyces roridus TaxID=1738132 RepID=A0AAD7BWX6_9AGAR|nr:TLC domain-containing protein [Roridomyces roridus]